MLDKKAWLVLILMGAVFIRLMNPAPALAAEALDVSVVEQYLQELDQELDIMGESYSLSKLWQQIKNGEYAWDMGAFLYALAGLVFKEVFASGALLGQLLVLAVICLVLTNLKESLGKGEISMLSRSVVYLLLVTIVISSFSISLGYAKSCINNMNDFLSALLPLLMTLLAAMGGITSVSVLHPAMLYVLSFTLKLMGSVVFPLIYFNAILKLIGQISPKFNLDKMAGLFKDIAMGVMSVTLTLFTAFLGLMGIAGVSLDGLAAKAVKTATGVFVPIVGRGIADALDSVASTTLLMKNSIGVIGCLVLLAICALPAIKILAQFLIFRLASAIIQPLGEEQLSNALYGISGSILLLFAAVAVCSLMFFFVLAIIVGVGNISVMMR